MDERVFAGTGAHILVITGFLVSLLLTTPLSLAEAVRRMPEHWATLREGVFAVMPERSIEVDKEIGNRRRVYLTQPGQLRAIHIFKQEHAATENLTFVQGL